MLRNATSERRGNSGFQFSFPPPTSSRNWFWQPPIEKNIFVGAWESSREVPAHPWRKNSKNRYISVGKKNSFTLPASPLPSGSRAQCQERPLWPIVSPIGQNESVVSAWLSQPCGHCLRGSLLPHPIQNTEGMGMTEVEAARSREKGGGSQQPGHVTQQRLYFLLNYLANSTQKPAHNTVRMHHLLITPPTTS